MRVFLEGVTVLLLFAVLGASAYTIVIKLTAPDIVVAGDMPRPVAVGVQRGDTLWSIAIEFYPGIPTGEAVYMIRQANPGVEPGCLQVGQRIILPEVS